MRLVLAVVVAGALAVGSGADADARVVVVDTSIEILQPVRFVGTTTELAPASLPTLDAVARTLAANPSITKLEVIGYGSDLAGTPLDQLALGARRARAIVGELVRRGIAPKRLQFSGAPRSPAGADPVPSFVIVDRRG